MNTIINHIIENFSSIKTSQLSKQGYPIFQFGIPHTKIQEIADYCSHYTNLFGHGGNGYYTTQIVFYSENDDVITTLNEFISIPKNKRNSERNKNNLQTFLKEHLPCFIDIEKTPLEELEYLDAKIYTELSDPKRYQEIQQKLDVGVCYLIRDEQLYTFRIPTQWVSPGNPALEGYYTKPIDTQEELARHMKAVNKLFDAGKLTYEVMLSGRMAKACIDNINNENAKLPNEYEYEQISILKSYAQLQKYPIETSIDKNGKHKVVLTTHYGIVDVLVGKKDKELLLVSYDDKKNMKMNLADFVDHFYYDNTKDKVIELVKKFKAI